MATIPSRQRVIRAARRTEIRLTLLLVAVVVLGVAAGVAGALDVRSRVALLDDAIGGNALRVLDVGHTLADANATIAEAFLAGSPESSVLRVRYRADIAQATAALTVAASSDSDTAAVAELSNSLPVYVGLVEDAVLAHNRPELTRDIAHQLGANYLREPAVLARDGMLPAAQRLSEDATRRLAASQDEADTVPWFALGSGSLLVACLIAGQIYLARRTRRLFNAGLVLATVAALGAVVWLSVVSATAAGHSEASRRDGTAQIDVLTKARVAGLRARADEAMALVAHGNGADYFDQRFDDTARQITGLLPDAQAAMSQPETRAAVESATDVFQRWLSAHRELRALADDGGHLDTVALATEARLSREFDSALGQAINQASTRLDDTARQARAVLSGTDLGVAILMAIAIASTAIGMWPRIAEYR